MAPKTDSKKARLARYLSTHSVEFVDETTWAEIAMELSPVSNSYLRNLLRESGVRLSPSVEGVNQTSFDALERTLTALAGAYSAANAMERAGIRRTVITGKDHAKWAALRLQAGDIRKQAKEEMVLWMRTWLENPELFAAWVTLRKRSAATESLSPQP